MRATPFLMFQGNAQEALDLYASLFSDFAILEIERYGSDGPGAEGTIAKARLRLAGLEVMCIDSPVRHAFGFTPSFSFFVDCENEEQQQTLADGLQKGGTMMMPLEDYGFSRRFTWFSDRFGVSWQLNLP